MYSLLINFLLASGYVTLISMIIAIPVLILEKKLNPEV